MCIRGHRAWCSIQALLLLIVDPDFAAQFPLLPPWSHKLSVPREPGFDLTMNLDAQPFLLTDPFSLASWQAVRTEWSRKHELRPLPPWHPWLAGAPGHPTLLEALCKHLWHTRAAPTLIRHGSTPTFTTLSLDNSSKPMVGSSSGCRDNRAAGQVTLSQLCCQHITLAWETPGDCSMKLLAQ